MPSINASLSFPLSQKNWLRHGAFWGLILTEILLVAAAALTGKIWLIFGLTAGLIVLLFSIRSFHALVALLLTYTCFFPVTSWGERYDLFKHYVSHKLILFLFLLVVLHWCYTRLRSKNLSIRLYNLDLALLLFLILAFLATVRGVRQGFNPDFIFVEITTLGLLGIYFLYVNHDMNRNDIRNLWLLFFAITVVVSVQYILVFISEFNILTIGARRITTQQPHLALIVLPFIYSTLLMSESRVQKLLAFLGMVPIILMVIISQQRGLWVAVIFSFLIFALFATLRSKITFRKILLLLVLFTAFTAGTIVLLQQRTQEASTEALSKRVETFTELETDQSLIARLLEIKIAFDQVGPFSLFGRGLGAQITRVAKLIYSNIVDNAYVYLYWKLGWTGLLTFLIVYFIFFRHCLKIIFHSENRFDQIIALSALSGMSGLCVVALTNVSLVLYRFNLVWALVLASVELIHRNVSKQEPEIASG